jgi:2-polyprenyl-3-methyl-5-hydroxy-6-metoxy-1,4-benzoquinol methylase
MKILVCVANHGTKNRRFLDRLLASYRSMDHEVHIVVLSDSPKDLGDDVEVLVGAPTSNPWSLPFGHRPLFADRLEQFDLFIYSEDDTLIRQHNLDRFVELNTSLPDDEVPGFLRYEVDAGGARSFCSIHSGYRWLPESVERRGTEVWASFTNEHSACYVLTREQLRVAVQSGQYLVPPHEGRYDMLVSAATDPYTRCGLRRRIPITSVEDVLLPHLPNVYLGQLGIDERHFQAQLEALVLVADGKLGRSSLLTPGTTLESFDWDVPQYPRASPSLASLATGAGRVLSVGCTSGRLERELFGLEAEITAIPIDEVCGHVARTNSLRTTEPDFEAAMDSLRDERFEVVLLHHVLSHVQDPRQWLSRVRNVLEEHGRAIVSERSVALGRPRSTRRRSYVAPPRTGGFDRVGVHAVTVRSLRNWAAEAGFHVSAVQVEASGRSAQLHTILGARLGTWLGDTLHCSLTVASGARRLP